MAARGTASARVIVEEPVEVFIEEFRLEPSILVEVCAGIEARSTCCIVVLRVQTEVALRIFTTALAARSNPLKIRIQPQHGRLSNGGTAHNCYTRVINAWFSQQKMHPQLTA